MNHHQWDNGPPSADDDTGRSTTSAAPTAIKLQQPEPPANKVLCLAKYKERTADTHQQHLAYLKQSAAAVLEQEEGQQQNGVVPPQVLMLGDSMVERFTTTGVAFLPFIQTNLKMALAGVGGDGVEHMVYRLHHGLLDNFGGTYTTFCFSRGNHSGCCNSAIT
jgi:hypothetical protein